MTNKHIRKFENFTTVNLSDLQSGTWDAERVLMAKKGRYPYTKINGIWKIKENPSSNDYRLGVLYMNSKEASELNALREEYLRTQEEYKRLEDSLKRQDVKLPGRLR